MARLVCLVAVFAIVLSSPVDVNQDTTLNAAAPVTPLEAMAVQTQAPERLSSADMEANFMDDYSWNNTKKAAHDEPTLIDEPGATRKSNNVKGAGGGMPDIVIAIPSMRRWTKSREPAPEQYLRPLVTTLRDQMTPEQQKHVTFLLMNVDKEPHLHKELLDLQSLPGVRVITKDRSAQIKASGPVAKLDDGREVSHQSFEWVAGETRDVPTLLLQASSIAPYVLFLEDDVKPTSQAVAKIYRFIDEMQHDGKGNFFMVDLYTPAISWGPKSAVNKEKYAYECCTQAMLFNSHRVREICDYELNHPGKPVDDNIRDFVKENPQSRSVYAMVPNPFEHIGRFSSNPEKSTGNLEHKSLRFEP